MTTVALATVEIWRLFKKNPKQKLFGEKSSLLGSFVGDGILEVKSHDLSSAKCKPPVTETRAPPIGRAANIDRRADEWEDAKGGQRKVKPCPENLQPVVSLLCACVHLWSSVDFSDRPPPPPPIPAASHVTYGDRILRRRACAESGLLASNRP